MNAVWRTREKWILFFLSLLLMQPLYAQESRRIEIVQANTLEGAKINNKEVRILSGNVIFKEGSTLMYCDSALFYDASNSIDATGNIRIEGRSTTMTGNTLHYDGNAKQAVISDNVSLTDGKMTLTTDVLNYNTESEVADYTTGGRVVDNNNVLTSRKGYYYSRDKMVYFQDSVVLNNPKYIMKSDTLRYNTVTATSYFLGPCYIYSTGADSSYIYCEYGWYNTKTEKSYFSKNAYIQAKENRLEGDSILYDRVAATGRAFHHVKVTDTLQKVMITGDYAFMNEKTHRSLVTGRTELIKIFDADSLFLHADTLYATEDTALNQKTYFAYRHVRIYKTDLQGKCDSLVYTTSDSTMRFYHDPVLWSGVNQMSADSVSLTTSGNKLHSMLMQLNAFIASQEDSVRFNQVSGRDMTGFFNDNELRKIRVEGNGQTIYYIRNKEKKLSGVNRAECSDMLIFVDSNEVQRITLQYKPDATLYPVREINPMEMRLKGFQWFSAIRPVSREDIFVWRE